MKIKFMKPYNNDAENWLDFYGEASRSICGLGCGLDW